MKRMRDVGTFAAKTQQKRWKEMGAGRKTAKVGEMNRFPAVKSSPLGSEEIILGNPHLRLPNRMEMD